MEAFTMKIINPAEFEAERKDNLLYLGRIRAADYIWVHRSGGDYSSEYLSCIAKDLQGDIVVTQTANNDDWTWAHHHLSGRVGIDDTVFVAAADLYRDSTIKRKAQYINSELLALIDPQLDLLGTVNTQNYHYDDYHGVIG
ncbi:MAG: hypothetical protein AABX31_00850, partial [Nanoarchaeota archaeon]